MRDLAIARAPSAPLSAGLYESHYLAAVDPAGGRALWLRHTTLKRPGVAPRATVWLTWFDRDAPAPRAWRVTASDPLPGPADRLGAAWSRSVLGEFGPGRAHGGLADLVWDLRWVPHAGELPYLPAHWLYDRPIPRSNGVALAPAAKVSGTIAMNANAPIVALSEWEGMIGHNWGSEHAEQWSWLHAGGLGEDRAGWIDLILVRVRLGPFLVPWIASGALCLNGRILRTARRGRIQRELDGERTTVRVPIAGGRTLELAVIAPETATVTWDYASPRGPGREVRNCSIADASLRLRTASDEQTCQVRGRFAVEHGAAVYAAA